MENSTMAWKKYSQSALESIASSLVNYIDTHGITQRGISLSSIFLLKMPKNFWQTDEPLYFGNVQHSLDNIFCTTYNILWKCTTFISFYLGLWQEERSQARKNAWMKMGQQLFYNMHSGMHVSKYQKWILRRVTSPNEVMNSPMSPKMHSATAGSLRNMRGMKVPMIAATRENEALMLNDVFLSVVKKKRDWNSVVSRHPYHTVAVFECHCTYDGEVITYVVVIGEKSVGPWTVNTPKSICVSSYW